MMRAIKDRCNISSGETSTCGRFSLLEVECLGACVNAPILQVNDDFYEDLDYQTTSDLLESLETGVPLPVGSVLGRSPNSAQQDINASIDVNTFSDTLVAWRVARDTSAHPWKKDSGGMCNT